MLRKLSLLVAAMLLLSGIVTAQNTVGEIDAYVRSVKKITGGTKNKIVVADTGDYEANKADWKKFASEKALEKHRETSETYSIAYNWKKDGRVVASNFTDFSPSGDWTQYTFHYFRPDGTIVKVEAELRTFNGDWIVERNYWFNKSGKQIKKTSTYRDLDTKKPKKPTPDIKDDSTGAFAVTYFKAVNKLPFAALLAAR
jgi:hypothetical protein